jgi:hypothetical protein
MAAPRRHFALAHSVRFQRVAFPTSFGCHALGLEIDMMPLL